MLRVDEQKLFTTNEIIAEQYRIIEFLGQPDKGLLYKAKHIPSNTTVIIRALSPDNPFDEKSKQRFLKRAKILTSLNHSNIARTLDFGFLENDAPYLITEYPEGQTLAEINKIKRQCDFRIALPIFKNVCLALAYIHGQNAAHGAIRPDNIILIKNSNGEETVKLTNFRVAQFARIRANEKTSPEFGEVFADPTYISPEECQGKQVTGSSDIYSLGCVMYETFAGVSPLGDACGTAALYAHVNLIPTPISEIVKTVPNIIDGVVLKALEKWEHDRYHSADELLAALELIQRTDGQPIIESEQPLWWRLVKKVCP